MAHMIDILYDDGLKRFFYEEHGKPVGEKHCHRKETVQWKTRGDFAARVEFGNETPFQVSGVNVPKHGPSDYQTVKDDAKGTYKYSVKHQSTGVTDDPDLIVDPD